MFGDLSTGKQLKDDAWTAPALSRISSCGEAAGID
jgi:hypothetical protein